MCHEGCCGCFGPQGPQGVPGLQGSQGIQGPSGHNGAPGSMGQIGPQGAKGDAGPQGVQGPAGAQGSPGQDGLQGPMGSQGPQGTVGAQGPQGLQGTPGKDCDRSCCEKVYLSLFSEEDQSLTAFGGSKDYAVFNSVAVISSPLDFDISLAAAQGKVTFLKAGTYSLAWDADGQLSPPFPSPVPSWAMGFYVNGVFVNGSGIAGFSQSPDDDATCLTSLQSLIVKAGDVIQLRNVSTFPIFLKSIHPELVVPMTCASFSAIKIG